MSMRKSLNGGGSPQEEALRQQGRQQLAEELREFIFDECRPYFGPERGPVIGLDKVRLWLNKNVPEEKP